MSADLIAIATLVAFGLLWMFVNMRTRSTFAKRLTYWLMWTFLIAASIHAARFVWGLAS